MKKIFPILAAIFLTGCHGYEVENGKWSLISYDEGVGRRVTVVKDADPNTFTPINREYAKDNKHVYLNAGVIEGADPNTFVCLENSYGKDNQKVFFQDKEIKNTDPNTFQVIEYGWSKDKNDVYCGNQPLKVVDLASFTTLHFGVLNDWAKDKSDYYFDARKIDCDYPTIKILSEFYGIDKNRAYYCGIPIEGVDVETFRVTGDITAKDKYKKYRGEKEDWLK